MIALLLTLLAAAGFDVEIAALSDEDGEFWLDDALAIYVDRDGGTAEMGDAIGRSASSLPLGEAVAFFRSADLADHHVAFRTWEALAA